MGEAFNTIDLERLALRPGEARRLDLDVEPAGLALGGQDYGFERGFVPARVDISRTSSGHAMRLRFSASLTGPCMRCLADSLFAVEIDAREVDQPGTGDEELASPYVHEGELDVGAWAHDALALELPVALLCRPDCPGLCPVCGVSLNEVDQATHKHDEAPDPRWAKLRELLD